MTDSPKHIASSPPNEPTNLDTIITSTNSVSSRLKTLEQEHLILLSDLPEDTTPNEETANDFECLLAQEKRQVLTESMKKLHTGLNEAKLLVAIANHLNVIESEKHMLKAQVRRLADENNWLRKELNETQQQLQDVEVELATLKEEKEYKQFLQNTLNKQENMGSDDGKSSSRDSSAEIFVEEEEPGKAQVLEHTVKPADEGKQPPQQSTESEVSDRLQVLHNLIQQYINQGKHEVAVPLCKKTLQDLEKQYGRNHPDVASMMNILALVYREQGKVSEAIQLLNNSLAIKEKVFGHDQPSIATTLNNLSVLHGKVGNYREAERNCRRALEIRQKALGANHPDVAKQLSNLAVICQKLGKYEDVEWYLQRAVEIYTSELGSDDPNVTKTMSILAESYLKQRKYKAAENMYKQILQLASKQQDEAAPAPPTPESRSRRLSSWTPEREMTPKAGDQSSEKGKWFRSSAMKVPTVSSTLHHLSAVYRSQGRNEEADTLANFAQKSKQTGLDTSEQSQVAEVLGSNIVSVDREDSPPPSDAPDRLNSSASSDNTLKEPSSSGLKRKGSFSRIKRMFGISPSTSPKDEAEIGGSRSAGTSPNQSRSGSPIPAEVKSKMTRSPLTAPKRKSTGDPISSNKPVKPVIPVNKQHK
ncbi:kinesin light chain-like [Dysidea avara]|uniref:kinesin light chain-like n=1 Tax=Dysidea avara TaxID=196820 RepID=UPI00332D0F1B